jgi:hypothetical protein
MTESRRYGGHVLTASCLSSRFREGLTASSKWMLFVWLAVDDTSETNRVHLVLFGMQSRTSGPCLASINRILNSFMDAPDSGAQRDFAAGTREGVGEQRL